MKKLATAFVTLILLLPAGTTRASTPVTFSGSVTTPIKKERGEMLQASAIFVVSNLNLYVTLSNAGTSNPRSPGDILTGLFFDINGKPKLTPVSATVTGGPDSSVISHRLPQPFDGDIGAEWAYTNNLADLFPGGTDEGISSTKLKWFKKKDLFDLSPNSKIPGTSPLSGVQFGITTLDYAVSKDQSGLNNKGFVQNTMVFVFSGLPENFTVSDISDVNFQYGSSLKPGFDITGDMVKQIPEPSALVLIAVGLVGAAALTRARARR
jgi:hypothetical protein